MGKIELNKEPSFKKNGFAGYTYPLSTKMQINFIDCWDKHDNYFIYGKTFVYYIVEGRGKFKIGDKLLDVTTGDMIEVPANTETTYKGLMKLLLIIQDGFERELDTPTKPTDI